MDVNWTWTFLKLKFIIRKLFSIFLLGAWNKQDRVGWCHCINVSKTELFLQLSPAGKGLQKPFQLIELVKCLNYMPCNCISSAQDILCCRRDYIMRVRPSVETPPSQLMDALPALTWALLWQPLSALFHCLSLKLLASNRQFIKPLIPLESSWNKPEFFKVSFPFPSTPLPLFFVFLWNPPGVERPSAAPSPPRSLVHPQQCAIFHRVYFIGWLLAGIWHHWPPLIDELSSHSAAPHAPGVSLTQR